MEEKIDDEKVKEIFYHFNQNVSNRYFCNPKKVSYYVNKQNGKYDKTIYSYIMNRYHDGSHDFKENLYRILLGIEHKPICKRCKSIVNIFDFNKKNYWEYCSISCLRKSVKYHISNETIKNRIEKWRKTCIDKYGVDNVSHLPQVREAMYKYNHSIKNIEHCKKIARNPLVRKKSNETKRKNHSFNISSLEIQAYNFLSKYTIVSSQYNKDERYPYCCDFYLNDLDIFIECNFHWTHGKHPYNANSIKDQVVLEQWKSKKTKYYDNAIETWTVRDVKKRNKAKENKLNYLEFWSLEELKEYFSRYFEK